MVTRLLFAAMLTVAMPAVAQVAQVVPVPERASPEVVGTARDAAAQPVDRRCLRYTGSHIRSRATAQRPDCGSTGIGRVYTRDDIARTGHTDIAQALRMLDPSIY